MDSLDRTYLTSENCFLSLSQSHCLRGPAYSFSAVPDLCGPGAGAPVRRVNAWRPEAGPRRLQTRMRLRSLAAHLPRGPVPNRPQTSTGPRPGAGDPGSRHFLKHHLIGPAFCDHLIGNTGTPSVIHHVLNLPFSS